MKITINHYHAVASWKWNLKRDHSTQDPSNPNNKGEQEEEEDDDDDEDVCGICRVAYDGCCPDCKVPGDSCPPSQFSLIPSSLSLLRLVGYGMC